jgi:hypothetical protein
MNELQQAWFLKLKDIYDYFQPDCWFVTLCNGFEVPPSIEERRVKSFSARLQQSLRTSGGGKLCWFIENPYQQREVFHYHMLIFGNGLGNLDKRRAEERWCAITNYDGSSCKIYLANEGALKYFLDNRNFTEDNIQVKGCFPPAFSTKKMKV